VTPELHQLCVRAARAVGGGVLAVDVLEDPQRGYLVNEVNHTMEFHTLAPATGIDVARVIVDYTLRVAQGKVKLQPPNMLDTRPAVTRLTVYTFNPTDLTSPETSLTPGNGRTGDPS
jgi:hypothetical protein